MKSQGLDVLPMHFHDIAVSPPTFTGTTPSWPWERTDYEGWLPTGSRVRVQ